MLNEQLPSRPKRLLSYTLIFLTVVYPLHPAWGAAMTAADKNTQISQQNNVPIINIATPNGAGISHNKFQQFNVDKQGAVLNNATTNVNSQIAGQIKANANLKGNAANLIINEVTGSSRSELQGKLEVAGKGANVVIANPNGITCNGCSFVNTPAITLTTGKPILDNKGALSAVEVKKGSVVIGANGMNAEAQTYADIISRATELNGQIKAKNLTLMQGTNRVDFQKGTVTPIAGEGAKPSISVDTKALGGMYANQVKLVSTEAGVGINLSNVQINQNDLTLTVDGKITLAGNIQGKKDINVSTKNLQINTNAKVSATKDITLATNTLVNNGQVTAGKDMRVFADNVSNTGNNALIQAQDNLWMQKNAKGDLSTLIENKSGTIKTNAGDLVVRTKKLENTATKFTFIKKALSPESSERTDRSMGNADMFFENFIRSLFGDELYSDVIDNTSPQPVINKWFGKADLLEYPAYEIARDVFTEDISTNSRLLAGKNLYVNANQLTNKGGTISAVDNMILTGDTFNNEEFLTGRLSTYATYNPVFTVEQEQRYLNDYNLGSYRELNKFWSEYTKQYAWMTSKIIPSTLTAGKNLTIDFKNTINLESKLPSTEKPIAKIVQIGNPSFAITAKNIILNSNNINISTNLQSENDLSIIAGQNINIHDAQLVAKQSQSLIANNDLNLKQVNLTAKDSTLIARNGNLQYSLNPVSAFKDNILSPPVINAASSLHIQSGKNITFDNAQLAKTNKLTLSTNDNIVIRRDESSLIKLAAFEPAANINALLAKTGNWTSSGEINLTAGKNIEARGIAFNSGKSLTANAGQDILLGSKAIKDVDNVFKTHRYPELRSQLITNGNITLNAARDIDLQSANLQSKDKIIALSGRDIKLTATAYSAIPSPHEDNQDVRYVTSTLSGDKGVTLASNGALTAQGSTIKSLGDITISSGGNVRLESVKTHYRKQEGKRLEDLYRQIGTEINSGKTLTILSEGSILFQASRLVAKGSMDIAAKGGYLYAQAMEETSHYEEQKKKCNKWTLCITKKEVKKTRGETTNKVTEFTASGDINLYAKDDVTLEATKINSGKNAKITSQTGKVNFKAVKNTTFEQVISNSKGFYITQQNKGYTEGKWILPSLHIGGKLTVDANKGITADVKTKEGQSFEQTLVILSRTPGYEWLGDVKNNKNVNWAVVKDAYSQWNKKTESLNPVVGAVIAIAAAAATYGTSTAASIGGLASSTATTMGASATTASVASVAAQAGFASLISQASVALAENKGNLSKTLSSLGQSDTVKSIVASMIIAGSLEGFDIALYGKVTDPAKVTLPKLNDKDWNLVAQRIAGQSVISSTIGTSIQGGSFSENFKTALLSNVAGQIQAEGANLIGDKFQYLYVDKQGQIIGHTGKAISHMALAGLSAEISGSNVKGAVVGALAAEIASISLDSKRFQPQFESEAAKQVYEIEKALKGQSAVNPYLVKFIGGLTGALVTNKPEGAYSAANSAELVYRYNDETHYISPSDVEYANDLYLAMKGDKTAQQRVDARDKALVYSLSAGALGYTVLYFGTTLVAVAPELVSATKTAFTGCKAAPTICASNVGAHVSNIVVGDVAPAATTGSFLIIGKNAAQIENVVKPAYEEVKTLKELFKYDTPSAKAFLSQSNQRLQAANLVGQRVTLNYKVLNLNELKNPALNVSLMRNKLTDYVKGNKVEGISIAAGAIKINGKTDYILAVSGKSWKGDAPKQINIDGINYKVVVSDSKSVPSTPTNNGQTNYNHAEQKLFSDINDNYKGKNAEITIAVENTSKSNPGMCVGCQQTSLEFAKQNERFNITIYQGTTGIRKE